jgi:glycine cleavage system transcriptional repressor
VPHLAVTALGPDRPGIIAALAGVLVAHDINLADSQMGLLGGRFGLLATADAPDDTDLDLVAADLSEIADDLGLDHVTLHVLDPVPDLDAEPTHMVTVYGIDHPGIVHAIATELARQSVSITDLSTRRVAEPEEEDDEPLTAMMLEIAAPSSLDGRGIAAVLDRVADSQGVEITVRTVGD